MIELPASYNWVDLSDEDFCKVLNEVLEGDDNLFVQAKAGCGKSLIIKLASMQLRNVIVLSTTGTTAVQLSSDGIAAKTVHSFFQLSIAPILPEKDKFRLNGKNRELLKAAETIIIDEVSMMNAQIFDVIIAKIKHIRSNRVPRIILFGDIFQLPPVVNKNTQQYYDQYYDGKIMFFNSKTFPYLDFTVMKLTKSYRQSDNEFVQHLDAIGKGHLTRDTLKFFNSRVMRLSEYEKGRSQYVFMAPTNAIVNSVNDKYIRDLQSSEQKVFKIQKSPSFPENVLPEEVLIKTGAQVMITKNDLEAGYSNGTIGKVIGIGEDTVSVETEEGKIFNVGISKYEIYESYIEDGLIRSRPVAWAKQLDCKICKAMTIHKSQGKTFANAYIALGGWTPPGIIYVGLSRLTSLEGLGLSRSLTANDIKVYDEAVSFYAQLTK